MRRGHQIVEHGFVRLVGDGHLEQSDGVAPFGDRHQHQPSIPVDAYFDGLAEQGSLMGRSGQQDRFGPLVVPGILGTARGGMREAYQRVAGEVGDQQGDMVGPDSAGQLRGQHVHRVDWGGVLDGCQQRSEVHPAAFHGVRS